MRAVITLIQYILSETENMFKRNMFPLQVFVIALFKLGVAVSFKHASCLVLQALCSIFYVVLWKTL